MDKFRFLLVSLGVFVVVGISSCQEEVDFAPSLMTEEVLYLSGERVRLLGRIITNQTIEATDHGFYISENEQFSQQKVISLGERTQPGRFIGESDELVPGKEYFVKSYLRTSSGEINGNVIILRSLFPAVSSMAPNNGKAGITVTINGRNFTRDTEVFFGANKAQVLGIDFESKIRVSVPSPTLSATVPVKVISHGTEMILPIEFDYTTGKFAQIGVFPSTAKLSDNIALQVGGDFIVGLGNLTQGSTQTLTNKLWKYDLDLEQWSELDFPGSARYQGFSTGRYFGGGLPNFQREPKDFLSDFWKWENGSFIRLADIPHAACQSLSFEISEAVFVLGGVVGSGREVFRFDKALESWERGADAPISVNLNTMNFQYMGIHYFVESTTGSLFAFDPISGTWQAVGRYPGVLANDGGFGLTIGDLAYVGLEYRSGQIWELNMKTLSWVPKNDFPGIAQARNVGVFQESGKIYFLRNGDAQLSGTMQLWLFDPKEF